MSNKINVYSNDVLNSNDFIRDISNNGRGVTSQKNYLVLPSEFTLKTLDIEKFEETSELKLNFFSDNYDSLEKISAQTLVFIQNSKQNNKTFSNLILNFEKNKSDIGAVDFIFNYYDQIYEDRIKKVTKLNQIPNVYDETSRQNFFILSRTETTSSTFDYSLQQKYDDIFLKSSDSYDLQEINNKITLSQSALPYYNRIYIPNIQFSKTSDFSDFIKSSPSIEKEIISKLTSSNVTFVGDNNRTSSISETDFKQNSTNAVDYAKYLNNKLPEIFYNLKNVYLLNNGLKYEVIGYKIKKYLQNFQTPEQEFYVSNLFSKYESLGGPLTPLPNFLKDPKKDIILVDNQIKFGETYRYEIYAVIAAMSIENKYDLQNPNQIDLPTETVVNAASTGNYRLNLKLNVISSPVIKIVELPYFSFQTTCIAAPKIPQVDFYTKVSNDKEIIFTLNIEEEYKKPILIKQDDQKIFDKYVKFETNKVYFNQNSINNFEIYRIEDQKPNKISDFSDKLYKTIKVSDLKVTSFIDTIVPNRKYYYVFRTRLNEFISNPSDIYEVELINNDGGIIPNINIINKDLLDIERAEPISQMDRTFRRYISIFPNPVHLTVTDNTVGVNNRIPDNIINSPNRVITSNPNALNQSQLWGKKFKVRITSKSTGRKIDLNMEFGKSDKK